VDKKKFQNGMTVFILVVLCIIIYNAAARLFNMAFGFERLPEQIMGILFGLAVTMIVVAVILRSYAKAKKKQEPTAEASAPAEEKPKAEQKFTHCESCIHVGDEIPAFCLTCAQEDAEKPPLNYEEG